MEPNVDDPRYEGFGFDATESVRGKSRVSTDFMPDDVQTRGRAWTVTRMAHLWAPRPVSGRVRPYNDYPCVGMTIPAFSGRAVAALRDLLEANGELLPLVSAAGEYYAYNVTTVADVLDLDRSDIKWYSDGPRDIAMEVTRYEFHPEKLQGLTIFRLVEDPARTCVTNLFVERVRAHHLRGFVFRKLWPAADGDSGGDGGGAVTAQSVVVRLALDKAKPTKAEKQRVGEVMDRVDTLMLAAEAGGEYLGSLEGHEYSRRECRLFFSCPDADRLGGWLSSHAADLAWPGGLEVVRRSVPFDDFDDPVE